MANTLIQLKFSTVTAAPTSLNIGEPAYSYTSNTFFIGSPDGTGSIAIGGKFYLDQQQAIYNLTNAAFSTANSAGSSALVQYAAAHANAAFIAANSAGVYANSAFLAANIADQKAVTSGSYANSAFSTANSAASAASSAQGTADTALSAANAAQAKADDSFHKANAAYAQANTSASDITVIQGVNLTQNTNITTAQNTATAAFVRANNSLNANTGGQISGDLSITGNLVVSGNVVSIGTSQIVANDSLIVLAAGNYSSDILDIGFVGHYNDGANAHTGFIRDASTKEYQLFEGYTPELGANNNIDINDPSFKLATIRANLKSTTITVKGIDLLPYVNNAYTQANTATTDAATAQNKADASFHQANAAYALANTNATNITVIQGVNLTQNTNITTAQNKADASFHQANAAYAQANTSAGDITAIQGVNLTQNTNITTAQNKADGAFNHANAAFSLANGTAGIANTDFTNLTITAANHGTASAVASFRVEANGRISSANNTAIAIDTSAIISGTLGVARGGTGAGSFTTNGVLLGQGTSTFTTASSSTEGHVLTINSSGVPTFAHLSGGTF